MISTRLRPQLLGGAIISGFALRSGFATAQQATPTTPDKPSPPPQPATGPGGAEYIFDTVVVKAFIIKDPPGEVFRTGYWLFEPGVPRPSAPPADEPLPLVLFLVGGMVGADPKFSREWIDHIVRRGAVVLYPTGSSISEIQDTKSHVTAMLAELTSGGHSPIDVNRVAVVGQGFGGPMATRLAVEPPEALPEPSALMVVTPMTPPVDQPSSLPADFARLPAATRVVLVGAEDAPESGADLDAAWAALAQAGRVPVERRAYVELRSDGHGVPALEASQNAAHTVGFTQPDALDWFGTWKLLDGLMACAFNGEWCEYAFGNTPEQRFMGVWSDGVPANEAIVVEDPGTPVDS